MNKQKLIEQIKQKNTFLCVGLDHDVDKLPKHICITSKEDVFNILDFFYILNLEKENIIQTQTNCLKFLKNCGYLQIINSTK